MDILFWGVPKIGKRLMNSYCSLMLNNRGMMRNKWCWVNNRCMVNNWSIVDNRSMSNNRSRSVSRNPFIADILNIARVTLSVIVYHLCPSIWKFHPVAPCSGVSISLLCLSVVGSTVVIMNTILIIIKWWSRQISVLGSWDCQG